MKRILTLIIITCLTGSAFSQADSLAKNMNGFYKWNGEQFFKDSLWIDTNIAPTTGNVLSLDTTDWQTTGYSKITTTSALTGSGATTRIPFFNSATSLTSANSLVYDEGNLTLKLRRIANSVGQAGMGIFYDNFKRFTVDSNVTIFNENNSNGKDVVFLSPTDSIMTLDVDNDRVGINASELDMSNATFTIASNGSDTLLKFINPVISSGANTPSLNTSPYSGAVRWLHIKVFVGGSTGNAVIPIVFE